jgi:hypothetical protein
VYATSDAMGDSNTTSISYDSYRRPVTFGLLSVVVPPSILCALLILGFSLTHWHAMVGKAVHHHAILLLTVLSFVYTISDLPFSMNYLRIGSHPYRSIPFCLWWYWFDYSLLASCLFLTATASVQRHILIFHAHWLQVGNNRLLLHYIPLITSIVYPHLFYVVIMFSYPCQVYYDPNEGWCAYPCYLDIIVPYHIDWFVNTVLPVLVIIMANVALVVRVMRSMSRIRQQRGSVWRRQKRLTLQLLAFSSLYIVVWFPTTTLAVIRNMFLASVYDDVPGIYYMYHLIYFVCPLQPLLCIFALPELRLFIDRQAKRLRRRTPVTAITAARSTT